tara:strand:- start:3828 stop:4622 length:795 start_codon:yes stop_codon:yes gene_type:complete
MTKGAEKDITSVRENSMATVVTENKKFFAIEGLPRSGTTILTNIFNSFENGFCFSEPIWQLIQDPWGLKLGKLNNQIWPKSLKPEQMISELKRALQRNSYVLGGLKETYRDWQTECVDLIDDKDLDFRIFIVRRPEFNFSGWKKTPFGAEYYDVDVFLRNYKNFFDRIEEKAKVLPTYIIKYENLCASDDPLAYVGNMLRDQFSISGDLHLKNTGYTYGDVKGNNSSRVEPARSNMKNLKVNEANLCLNLGDLYATLPEGLWSR